MNRVLVLSLRRLRPHPSRAANVEMEECLRGLDRVQLEVPEAPVPSIRWQVERVQRRLPFNRIVSRPALPPPAGEWDLLFLTCQSPSDLLLLGSLAPWRERCGAAVVWIDELWAHSVPRRPLEMQLLSEVDQVFLGCHGSIPAVEAATGRPVRYAAPAVDALAFCPWPDPPERSIDIYNMGRRAAVTHRALLELAERRRWFYLHDTLGAPDLRVQDPVEHRRQLIRIVQRAGFFVANRAKANAGEDTHGQEEVGFRFFEGAAGGAVLVGDAPRCPTFASHFGWEDAVVHLPWDAPDPARVLDALLADPERIERIRRRNVAEVLRRHDWSHRWAEVLATAGLEPSPALVARQARLRSIANGIERPEESVAA